MLRKLMTAMAAIAAFVPAPASAQAGEATMFSQGHFKGAQRTIIGPTQFSRPFVMKSVRMPEGTEWEFCSGNTYSGCRQISRSKSAMVMTVRSARPVATILPSTAAAMGQSLNGTPGQSLRGVASEYFVAPGEGGNRIEVQPGTAEAMSRRAAAFCRARGWRSSAHGRLQRVGGRVYLADVLCVDS